MIISYSIGNVYVNYKPKDWEKIQRKIKEDANKARSEAAKEQPRTDIGFAEKQVQPHIEATPDYHQTKTAAKKAELGVSRLAQACICV